MQTQEYRTVANKSFEQSVHDYYNNVPVPRIVEKVLVEICAGYAEGKRLRDIKNELNTLGVEVSILELQKVIDADRYYTEGSNHAK